MYKIYTINEEEVWGFPDAQIMNNVLMYYLLFSVVIYLEIALNIKSSQQDTNMKNSVSDVSFIIHEYDKVKLNLCTWFASM